MASGFGSGSGSGLTESLWVLGLVASKCKSLNMVGLGWLCLIVSFVWFLRCLFHWAHPGGPAWGSHKNNIYNNKYSNSNINIPGPRGVPLIGSINLMSGLAHHKIASAARCLGATRLMAFSLGETRMIVTCNPEVARQILNSSVFADRPVKESAYRLMFDRAIGFAPYGLYWRTLRKIAANHLFCANQIKASEAQRALISDHMLLDMFSAAGGLHVCVRDVVRRASLYNMMWSVFGLRGGLDSELVVEMKKLVEQGYQLLGVVNWSDHLPWLTPFDPQGVRFGCSQLLPKVNSFLARIIQQHRALARAQPPKSSGYAPPPHDFTDILLSLQGPHKLSDSDIIAILWEMIFRGTDTVAVLMEWILARLVVRPDVQSRVQDELDEVVGRSRAVTESDLTSLVYLGAVVKEVLRLHPPGPLLSWARLAVTDTEVDGYHVPAGTTAMVNMWAISRDPQVWKDPLEFRPERFLEETETEFSVMGSDLRLAPFGSGRRSCPGKALGLTTVTFWVASVLHEFRLGTGTGTGTETCDGIDKLEVEVSVEVDLSEVLKLSCEMANPLVVNVRPRRMPI